MGKGKPRHDPDKKQNTWGSECWFAERIPNLNGGEHIHCELGMDSLVDICQGNPHNCKKAQYRNAARRSDRRKNLDGTY